MDRMLYIAMSGAKETMLAQAVNTQNLANVSTTAFRADLESFISQPVYGPGYDSRVYALDQGEGTDFSPGSLITTGRDLDVAVNGDGWIAVQGADGKEAYTRRGDLHIDSVGLLTNGAGRPVLGNGGPIAIPPAAKVEIGQDGTISVLPVGQTASTLAVVDRIKLVNPNLNRLEKGSDGLVRTGERDPVEADASVRLASGALESSNVSAVDAMVRMIELARQFEHQVKMMQTAEENDRAAAQLLRVT